VIGVLPLVRRAVIEIVVVTGSGVRCGCVVASVDVVGAIGEATVGMMAVDVAVDEDVEEEEEEEGGSTEGSSPSSEVPFSASGVTNKEDMGSGPLVVLQPATRIGDARGV